MKLLAIDDDISIHQLLKKFLNPLITLECTETLPAGARDLEAYDLIILDLMLGRTSSLQFLQDLKISDEHLLNKIILLTGTGDEKNEVEIHKLGVLDYIKKPFSPQVLSAVVDKHLSKIKKSGTDMRYGPFILDISDYSIYVDDQKNKLDLTNTEYKILKILMESRGRVVTREKLMTEVWNIDDETQTRTVDMHVSTLRKKIQPHGDLLKTKRGIGYFLEEK